MGDVPCSTPLMGEVLLQYSSERARCEMYGLPRSSKTAPPPKGNLGALDTVLLQGSKGRMFLVSEVPM